MLTERQVADYCQQLCGNDMASTGAGLVLAAMCDPDDEDAAAVFGWVNMERTKRQLAAEQERWRAARCAT